MQYAWSHVWYRVLAQLPLTQYSSTINIAQHLNSYPNHNSRAPQTYSSIFTNKTSKQLPGDTSTKLHGPIITPPLQTSHKNKNPVKQHEKRTNNLIPLHPVTPTLSTELQTISMNHPSTLCKERPNNITTHSLI